MLSVHSLYSIALHKLYLYNLLTYFNQLTYRGVTTCKLSLPIPPEALPLIPCHEFFGRR
jgi:hypothetical protein